MTAYSVAHAKSGLPRLIDLALEGEEVIISRHGKPVAELRPIHTPAPLQPGATYDWLRARRDARPSVGLTSVQILDQMYDDPEA
jgi:antitoxin (DNA-binding transcriptional repressor) of toxin-antitoxin stability system